MKIAKEHSDVEAEYARRNDKTRRHGRHVKIFDEDVEEDGTGVRDEKKKGNRCRHASSPKPKLQSKFLERSSSDDESESESMLLDMEKKYPSPPTKTKGNK